MKKGAKRYAARIFEDGTPLAQSSGPLARRARGSTS